MYGANLALAPLLALIFFAPASSRLHLTALTTAVGVPLWANYGDLIYVVGGSPQGSLQASVDAIQIFNASSGALVPNAALRLSRARFSSSATVVWGRYVRRLLIFAAPS